MLAFKDVPESSLVTEVAVPEQKAGFGLEHDEGVVAGAGGGDSHGEQGAAGVDGKAE